jgi:hypothetical protein
MKRTPLAVLLLSMMLASGISFFIFRSSATNAQKNKMVTTQGTEIILNYTDYNATVSQFPPNLNITIAPRIIIECADATFQLETELPQGFNPQVTPRIIVEYADYEVFAVPYQTYQGPSALSIGSPAQNPLSPVQLNTSVTISVNITDPFSPLKNVTLYYDTTIDHAWHPLQMTCTSTFNNGTIYKYTTTIPGQGQPCDVNYVIKAYELRGDQYYVMNDNAGQYWVYNIIPEFPSLAVLTLFMIATLGAVVVYRRKHSK